MLIIGRDNGVLITIVPVAVPVEVIAGITTAPVAEGAGGGEYDDAPPGHDDTTTGGGVHVGSVIWLLINVT